MKRILCVVLLAGIATASYFAGRDAAAAEREREYRGVLVYIGDDFLEIKRGRREFRAYYDAATRYYDQAGVEASLNSLDLCQLVKVRSVFRDRKHMIVSVHIERPGQCRK